MSEVSEMGSTFTVSRAVWPGSYADRGRGGEDPGYTDRMYLGKDDRIEDLPLHRLLPLMRMCAKYQGKPINCARCLKRGGGCAKGLRLIELTVDPDVELTEEDFDSWWPVKSARDLWMKLHRERGSMKERQEVCSRAGISIATYNSLIAGTRTHGPRLDVTVALLDALGYEIVIRKQEGKTK